MVIEIDKDSLDFEIADALRSAGTTGERYDRVMRLVGQYFSINQARIKRRIKSQASAAGLGPP